MYSLDNRHSLKLPYWARPGIRLAVAPGGDGGDDGDDGDEGDDDGDDDEDDDDLDEDGKPKVDDPDKDKTPEEIKAELIRTRATVNKLNGRELKRRKERKAAEAEAAKNPPTKIDEKDVDKRIAAAVDEATASVQTKANDRIINSEAKALLAARGADPKRLTKLLKMLDRDDLEVEDDGVDGLEDAIDDLVTDWPELFSTKKPRKRIAGNSDRLDKDGKRKTLSATERQAAQLLGKSE